MDIGLETGTLSLVATLSTLFFSLLPIGVQGGHAGSFSSLTTDHRAFIVRADNGQPSLQVNVFADGRHAYSFERTNRFTKQWVLYSLPDRRHIAVISIGLLNRSVHFIGKPAVQHRQLTGLIHRTFHLTDGATYTWTRLTQNLERIVNAGQGHEEHHERVARVRLLRRFRFDWEVLVDRSFDAEVALTTAFVAMLTQWPLYSNVIPGIPTIDAVGENQNSAIQELANNAIEESHETPVPNTPQEIHQETSKETPHIKTSQWSKDQSPQSIQDLPAHLLVYEEPEPKRGDFFIPPTFLDPK